LRILIFNYEYPPLGGGGGVFCKFLAEELVKTGHTVDYLTSRFGDFKSSETINGVDVYRVPIIGRRQINKATLISLLSFPIASFLKGYSLCRKKGYDLINIHFVVPSGPSAYLLGKMFQIPCVTSIHGGDIYDPSKRTSPHNSLLARKVIHKMLEKSKEVIAQSENTRENAVKYYDIEKDIHLIPLGFPQPEFNKGTRKELGLSEEDFILVSVGRVVKRKGYDYALQAISMLKHIDSLRYMIIGRGPELKNLQQLAKKLDIEEKVIFKGYVEEEEKFQYLAAADVYLLSSLHEGFGICLMEAMSVGLPIISTDNGGQMDFLREEENALLIKAEKPGEIAQAVQRLLDSKPLCEKMGRINTGDVKKYYIGKIANDYLTNYREAIKKR